MQQFVLLNYVHYGLVIVVSHNYKVTLTTTTNISSFAIRMSDSSIACENEEQNSMKHRPPVLEARAWLPIKDLVLCFKLRQY